MNQRILIGIIILAGIGSIGSVMAFSGTISAGQGNFNNVLVTGTCTGCGGGVNTTSHVVIPSETAGTVVISPFTCDTLSGSMLQDGGGLYDGSVDVQVQKRDNTWQTVMLSNGLNTTVVNGQSVGGSTNNFAQSANQKIPMIMKVVVNTQSTMGTYTLSFRCP